MRKGTDSKCQMELQFKSILSEFRLIEVRKLASNTAKIQKKKRSVLTLEILLQRDHLISPNAMITFLLPDPHLTQCWFQFSTMNCVPLILCYFSRQMIMTVITTVRKKSGYHYFKCNSMRLCHECNEMNVVYILAWRWLTTSLSKLNKVTGQIVHFAFLQCSLCSCGVQSLCWMFICLKQLLWTLTAWSHEMQKSKTPHRAGTNHRG